MIYNCQVRLLAFKKYSAELTPQVAMEFKVSASIFNTHILLQSVVVLREMSQLTSDD